MRKVLFLMFLLLLMGLGAAGVKAQVRIGGNGAPNAAAVLDLNATDATNNGTKGLALPRVSLSSNAAQITTGVANLTGMMVYNTNATLGVGIYFWNGTNWIIISGDGIVGNELTDTITGGGLLKTGSGTAADPWKIGIANKGVSLSMLRIRDSSYEIGAMPAPPSIADYVPPIGCVYPYFWVTFDSFEEYTWSVYNANMTSMRIRIFRLGPTSTQGHTAHVTCLLL